MFLLLSVYFIAHEAYIYSFFFLCTEFHFVRMQTKFCQNSHTTWKVQQLCYVVYHSANCACVWLATVDNVECTFLQMSPQPTVPLLCHEPLKQHNVQTRHVVFEVFQFPMQFCPKYFSLRLNICRVTLATITETSVDLRFTYPLFCPILTRTATAGQISLLIPI